MRAGKQGRRRDGSGRVIDAARRVQDDRAVTDRLDDGGGKTAGYQEMNADPARVRRDEGADRTMADDDEDRLDENGLHADASHRGRHVDAVQKNNIQVVMNYG